MLGKQIKLKLKVFGFKNVLKWKRSVFDETFICLCRRHSDSDSLLTPCCSLPAELQRVSHAMYIKKIYK